MNEMSPLNSEERDFAAEHHGLINSFLYIRKLPADEYYDVAVFGYLRAVKKWFANEDLWQYSFSTIAFNSMRSSVGNYLRQQRLSVKAYGMVLSLQATIGETDDFTLEDTIQDPRDLYETLEAKETVRELLEYLTPKKRAAVFARLAGYDTTRSKLIKI